jgi:hypothetical protein
VRIQKGLAERIGLCAFMNGHGGALLFARGRPPAHAAGRTKARGVHISSAAVETMSLRYSSVVVSAAANNRLPHIFAKAARRGSDQGQVSTERSRSFQSTKSNAERVQKMVGKMQSSMRGVLSRVNWTV